MAMKWYGVHTYSGYENKVKLNLEERIRAFDSEDLFGEVLIPAETVVELKNGERKTSMRKFFPGYVLVKMDMTDEAYHLIKNTPKVTGFLGADSRPMPEAAPVIRAILPSRRSIGAPSDPFEVAGSLPIGDRLGGRLNLDLYGPGVVIDDIIAEY